MPFNFITETVLTNRKKSEIDRAGSLPAASSVYSPYPQAAGAGAVPPRNNGKLVKSAARALAVLEFFDERQAPATSVTIAAALRIPNSSASVLVRSLVSLGYLSYDPSSRTYVSTVRVALLGNWLNDKPSEDHWLMQLMTALNRSTGELVAIGTRNGVYAQILQAVQATAKVRLHVRPGTFVPLTRTSIGWVLLSTLEDQQVVKLVRRVNAEEESPKDRVQMSWLMERVRETRREGYAFCFGGVHSNVGAIGMLVPRRVGNRAVVLAAGGIGEDFIAKKTYLVDKMRKAIEQYCHNSASVVVRRD